MEDSKFSYTAVRIYNANLISKLDKAFERTETSFASNRSQFLVHLIELGLASYMDAIEEKRGNSIPKAFNAPTDAEDVKKLLDKYISYSRDFNEKHEEQIEVCEALAASILNILLASLEGEFVDKEAFNQGKYDKLPERFKKGDVNK